MKGAHGKGQIFNYLLDKVREIVEELSPTNAKLLAICKLLMGSVPHYDWVGFYLVHPSRKRELVLGPFVGEPTEHVRIPFGKGICGQAAETREIYIVDDVSKESNYLSCSEKVRSEIVVPILKNGEIVGELDIDSHTLSAFTEEDGKFLENVCEIVYKLF
jgi:L-methionine (R)-S-oxide reductase